MNTQGRRQKAKGESRKAEGSIHDPRPTTHAVPEVLNEGRRKFMLGAAGFTFGIVAGVPVLLRPEETRAQSAKSVAINAWVTLYTDGTVATRDEEPDFRIYFVDGTETAGEPWSAAEEEKAEAP